VRLQITERTVKAHVTGIFNKLGVNSRAEAVAVALRGGFLPVGPRE
jgi:NarL family two-component system response regulator YdfI